MSLNYANALKKSKKVPLVKNIQKSEVLVQPAEKIAVPVTQPSICIPRLPPSFNDGQIIEIFNEINLGNIDKIDIINKTNGDNDYLMAFIHFASWRMEGEAKTIHEGLMNDEKITVYYDDLSKKHSNYLLLTRSYSARPGTEGTKRKSQKPKNKKRYPTNKFYDENSEKWLTTKGSMKNKKEVLHPSSHNTNDTSKWSNKNGFLGLDVESSDEE